ncbi:MAG: hypothetical protein JNK38_25530 [Acidobacteria bacterium]|nr:hypothetical protein [Acidobacteriota bacterium]
MKNPYSFGSNTLPGKSASNLDMLKTRNPEPILLVACLEAKQPFVADSINLTREAYAGYISQAKAAGKTGADGTAQS